MKYIKLIIITLLLFQSIYAFAEDERVVMVLEVNNIETSTGNIMQKSAGIFRQCACSLCFFLPS